MADQKVTSQAMNDATRRVDLRKPEVSNPKSALNASKAAVNDRFATKISSGKKPAVSKSANRSGSKGNISDDKSIEKAKRLKDESRQKLAHSLKRSKRAKNKMTEKPWMTEKLYGAKIYKLTAYTTVEKIDQKFKAEQRQVFLRKLLATLIILLVMIIMIAKLIDLKDIGALKQITGDDVFSGDPAD